MVGHLLEQLAFASVVAAARCTAQRRDRTSRRAGSGASSRSARSPSWCVHPLVGFRDGGVLDDLELVHVGIVLARDHRLLQATGQVIVMPAGLNHQHTATRR
jgi:hypothetical protein